MYYDLTPLLSRQFFISFVLGERGVGLSEGQAQRVALAGGVASNSGLRNTMNDKCQKAGIRLMMPPPVLCTDNAAMIGSAAFYRLMRGEIASLDLNACPSLRLV